MVRALWLQCETQCKQGEFLCYSFLGIVKKRSKCWNYVKQRVIIHNTFTFISITGVSALTIMHSVFSVLAGLLVEMLFMLFSIYNTA